MSRAFRRTDTREYVVTTRMWITYEADESLLPCSLEEYVDENLDPLPILHEHLVMDPRSALMELRGAVMERHLVESFGVSAAGGIDVTNVSDVTGEEDE